MGVKSQLKAFNLYNSNSITKSLEMGCLNMRCCESYAVSEVIGITTVLLVISGGIGVTLFWGVPYMEDKKGSVSLDSALLQLDVMGDLMEDMFNEGVNSGKTVSFQGSSGNMYLDPQGERFVFYYSVYKYDRGDFFDFNVSDFDPETGDPYSFTINVASAYPVWGNPMLLNFTFTRLNDSLTGYAEESVPRDGSSPITITCGSFPLSGAIRIDIRARLGPILEDCGRIWLFDVGSLIYQISSSSGARRVIVENGGVVSVMDGGGYLYNEARYWSQKLLDDTTLVTMRIIQIVPDYDTGAYSVGGNPVRLEFFIKTISSTVQESRQIMGGWFKMRIYGDAAAVSAWRYYYSRRMGFEAYPTDNDVLWLNFIYQSGEGDFPLFSFNYAVCNVGMEVKS